MLRFFYTCGSRIKNTWIQSPWCIIYDTPNVFVCIRVSVCREQSGTFTHYKCAPRPSSKTPSVCWGVDDWCVGQMLIGWQMDRNREGSDSNFTKNWRNLKILNLTWEEKDLKQYSMKSGDKHSVSLQVSIYSNFTASCSWLIDVQQMVSAGCWTDCDWGVA